jgi:DNA-binding GntR family transcriptional regulator
MADVIDPNSSSAVEGSFEEFSRQRKSQKNSRVIADTIHARLRDAILSAELRPNSRLVEDDLAEWLNVSRTPIREALLLLEKEGLVERNHGWLVREHNAAEIQARLECRLAIEGYAARLAAGRRSEADLQELRTVADAMEKPGIPHLEFYQINDRFHKVITEAANNPTLTILHSHTKLNFWALSVPVIFGQEGSNKIHAHHRALIEAIAAGDADKAESIARSHVQQTMEFVLDALGKKM